MSKIFLDTTVLICSFQSSDLKLQKQARNALLEVERKNHGVISTQVMQEFFVVATKKMGVDPLEAKGILRQFENFEVLSVIPTFVYEAIDCTVTERLSFWDALIVITAEKANCSELWSQDLNDGQTIRGVTIVNPFR